MKNIFRILAASALMLAGTVAQATVVSFYIAGENDCGTYYQSGNGFDSCVIFSEDDGTQISSIIAKWDDDEEEWEVSSNYGDFGAGDMTLNFTTSKSGSWNYNSDTPGIRFWVVKHGNGFTVYYDTDNEDCLAAPWTTECMSSANVVTSGEWNTSANNRNGLSHISFYDEEVRVPEPGTLGLLGLGLIGMGFARRRKST